MEALLIFSCICCIILIIWATKEKINKKRALNKGYTDKFLRNYQVFVFKSEFDGHYLYNEIYRAFSPEEAIQMCRIDPKLQDIIKDPHFPMPIRFFVYL